MNPLVVAYIIFISAYVFRELFLRKGKEAKQLRRGVFDKGSTIFGGVVIVAILLVTPLFNKLGYGVLPNASTIGWIGVLIMLFALMFHYCAVLTLGSYYTRTLLVIQGHRIVKKGPYKFIRHPGYLGYLIGMVGFGLATTNWIALLLLEFFTALVLLYRINREETMMIKKFGDKYREYMMQTKKLLPFIY